MKPWPKWQPPVAQVLIDAPSEAKGEGAQTIGRSRCGRATKIRALTDVIPCAAFSC